MLEGTELDVVIQDKISQRTIKIFPNPCVWFKSYCLTDFGNKFNHKKLDKYGNCACNGEFFLK